jgi:hypothetical protein
VCQISSDVVARLSGEEPSPIGSFEVFPEGRHRHPPPQQKVSCHVEAVSMPSVAMLSPLHALPWQGPNSTRGPGPRHAGADRGAHPGTRWASAAALTERVSMPGVFVEGAMDGVLKHPNFPRLEGRQVQRHAARITEPPIFPSRRCAALCVSSGLLSKVLRAQVLEGLVKRHAAFLEHHHKVPCHVDQTNR